MMAHDLYRQIWRAQGTVLFAPTIQEPTDDPADDTEAEVPDVREDEVPE